MPTRQKDARDCAQQAKADVKKKFPAAVASLKKNPKAADARKSCYVAWMAQIDGTAIRKWRIGSVSPCPSSALERRGRALPLKVSL